MKTKISKTTVDQLKNSAGKFATDNAIADTEVRGFGAERLPSGEVSFRLRYYTNAGKRRTLRLGLYGKISPDQARQLAKKRAGEVADDKDPVQQRKENRKRGGNTVNAVLDLYEKQYIDARKLKSGDEYKRTFTADVRPALGHLVIYDVKRSHVTTMLNKVFERAPSQSNMVLKILASALNWYAVKDEDFHTPLVKGMALHKSKSRSRILNAEEVRDVFLALEECMAEDLVPRCMRNFIHMLFFTALRLRMVANMHRDEIDGTQWIIPAKRNKTGLDFLVTLTPSMRELIATNNAPYIFSCTGGKKPFAGFYRAKEAIDKKLAEIRERTERKPFPHWTFHDIRRTGKFVMGQSGVADNISERVLAHTIKGIEGVYNPNAEVYAYAKEKYQATLVLEKQIRARTRPGNGKVIPFVKKIAA